MKNTDTHMLYSTVLYFTFIKRKIDSLSSHFMEMEILRVEMPSPNQQKNIVRYYCTVLSFNSHIILHVLHCHGFLGSCD